MFYDVTILAWRNVRTGLLQNITGFPLGHTELQLTSFIIITPRLIHSITQQVQVSPDQQDEVAALLIVNKYSCVGVDL